MMRDRSGIALVVVLMSLMILGAITGAVMIGGSGGLGVGQTNRDSLQAVHAAQAGTELALVRLGESPTFRDVLVDQLPNTEAEFHVVILDGPTTTPHGVEVKSGFSYIMATGTAGRQTRRIGTMIQMGSNPTGYAAFAAEQITFDDGSYTDTWDSTVGDYPNGSSPGRGHIATNSTAKGAVELTDGASVDNGLADIFVGPGGDSGAVVADDSNSFNSIQVLSSEKKLPPVVLPFPAGTKDVELDGGTKTLAPGAYARVEIDGGRLYLEAGGIYVFEEMRIDGGGGIGIAGDVDTPVEVYLSEELRMEDGGVFNYTKDPRRLSFKVAGNGKIRLDESGSAYYVAYAPEAEIDIDEGHMYGCVVGKTINLEKGSALHYDVSLGEDTSVVGPVTVVSRQEF